MAENNPKIILSDLVKSLAVTIDKANLEIDTLAKGTTSYAVSELNLAVPIVSLEISSSGPSKGESVIILPVLGQQTPHSIKITLKAFPKVEAANDIAKLPIDVILHAPSTDLEKLSGAGMLTVKDLSHAKPEELSKKTDIPIELIKRYIEEAKGILKSGQR